MSRPVPVRIGDRFHMTSGVWEVTQTFPGGRVDLFNRGRCRWWQATTAVCRTLTRMCPDKNAHGKHCILTAGHSRSHRYDAAVAEAVDTVLAGGQK